MTRDQLILKHAELTRRMAEITEVKNNDYGSSNDPFANFREFGELGFLVRMSDKWKRIKTALYEKRELQVTDETVEDTLLDLANYCLLLLCWREEISQRSSNKCEAYSPDEEMAKARKWTEYECVALDTPTYAVKLNDDDIPF